MKMNTAEPQQREDARARGQPEVLLPGLPAVPQKDSGQERQESSTCQAVSQDRGTTEGPRRAEPPPSPSISASLRIPGQQPQPCGSSVTGELNLPLILF